MTKVECSACGQPRDLAELVEVVTIRTGELRHVCRPAGSRELCFRRATLSAATHRIRDAGPRPAA